MRRVPNDAPEKDQLYIALDRHRDAVLWKVDGLTDAQLRRIMTPSGTSMLGLVKHLAWVEYGWFCDTFGGDTEPMPFDPTEPDADLRVAADETVDDILALYARARAAADRAIADLPVDHTAVNAQGDTVSVRWVLIHMIEETARHAGHLDILRELLDGATGDHPE